MAGAQTTLSLQDRLTGPLMKIMRAMDSTIKVMEQMDSTTQHLDKKSLANARKNITNASADLERLASAARAAGQNGLQPLQNQFTNLPGPVNHATNAVKNFFLAFAGASAAYLSLQGLTDGFRKFVGSSDAYVSTSARLALINDGLQTQLELQDKVYHAAQRSRSGYLGVASSVAKLNLLAEDAFSGNDEAIRFSELMGKSFTISGASTQERDAGMYQLTQAMAAGKLMGDEFRSIMENAPLLAQAIADSMGKTKGELKELSSEGIITADIIKTALFEAADEIEESFKNMPLTFAQAMTMLANWGLTAFEPLFIRFNQFVNSDAFQVLAGHAMWFVNVFIGGMTILFNVLERVYTEIGAIGQLISDAWAVIGPVIIATGSALAGYLTILTAVKVATLIAAGAKALLAFWATVQSAALALATGSTIAATVAQHGLNAALLAFPGTWILLAFVAVIALVIYAMIAWQEQTAAVIGAIVGSVYWLGAVFYNTLMGIGNFGIMVAEWFVNTWNQSIYFVQGSWIAFNLLVRMILDAVGNAALRVAEFFLNKWNDAIYGVQMAFHKMRSSVLTVFSGIGSGVVGIVNNALGAVSNLINGAVGGINKLIGMINNIPGVNISAVGTVDLKMSNKVSSVIDGLNQSLQAPTKAAPVSLGSFNSVGDYLSSVKIPSAPQQQSFDRLEYTSIGDAFARGQEAGANVSMKASEKLTGALDKLTGVFKGQDGKGNPFTPDNIPPGGFDPTLGGSTIPGAADKSKNPTGGKLDKIGKIDSDINIADEDLKLLLELADRKSIQEVNVSLSPTVTFKDVTVREEADIDRIVAKINKNFEDDMDRSIEGAVLT